MASRIGRAFVLALCLLVVLALAPPASASVLSAQNAGTCSAAGAVGVWGSSLSGTLFPPTGAVPFANVSRVVYSTDGSLSGKQITSRGGSVSEEAPKGTWTVNPDCTGTITVSIYDESGHVLRTAVWFAVYTDNQTEFRAIMKSLTLANGTSIPAVVTMNGKKLFAYGGNDATCSNAGLAGDWTYTVSGTLFRPTGPVLLAIVGSNTTNADGSSLGTQISSMGGTVGQDTSKSTLTINPDCTGTITAPIYDQSGNLLRTATWATLYVNNQSEFLAIMKSLVFANGTSVPTVLTMNGRKIAAASADPWEAQFTAAHGRPPTDQDRADRAWSLDFTATNGHPPSDADWAEHYFQTRH